MPGYSGTPLPKKLGIKDTFRLLLLDAPDDVKTELSAATEKCKILKKVASDVDLALLFAKSRAGLESELEAAADSLAPAGMLWIAWPKKSSGVASDLDENVVREAGLTAGLVDLKVCAITEIWSGLKFVIPVKDRPKRK
jgi:hypothetical protein